MRGRRALIDRWSSCRSLLLIVFCVFTSAACAQTVPTVLLPTSVAYDPAGNLYFADTNRNQVFESSLAGGLTVVAGTGVQGYGGDGGAAVSAMLDSPQAVAVGQDGTLYIADTGNQRIRAVSNGSILTFAGTGVAGFGGDGGAATAAMFSIPNALAIDVSGALLVSDSGNHRVRRVSAGMINTIAGNGSQGYAGDGAAATAASLDTPSGLAVGPDGRIFIADTRNNKLRVISVSGVISTVAGTGSAGYSGDGGAATSAQLAMPQGVVVTAAGVVLFADSNNQRVRMVDAHGLISTVAGQGVQGGSIDGSTALSSALDTPRGVAISSFGSTVFADSMNNAVRELIANGSLYLPAGLQPTRASAVSLTVGANSTFGQTLASTFVSGAAGTPQGLVQLMNGATVIAQGNLVAATVSFPVSLAPGNYVLSAAYEGDGVNPAASGNGSNVMIGLAPTTTSEQSLAQNSYAGLPLLLTANVSSTSSGSPTGTVSFSDGGTVIATAAVSSGVAAATYLSPTAGVHSIVAHYSGDADFAASSSAAATTTVGLSPDFTLTPVGNSMQTIQAGAIAIYTFSVAAQPGPFSGVISMSVSGLPKGATATFSPAQVIPGTGSVAVTLSIQTPLLGLLGPKIGGRNYLVLYAILLPLLMVRRRSKVRSFACSMLFVLGCAGLFGCGDRTLSSATQGSTSYNLVVSGTGTSLTGSLLVHSTPVSLIVQ